MVGFHYETEVDNVRNPYNGKGDSAYGDVAHQNEADGQKKRNRREDSQLCFQGHRFFGDVSFQYILIELRGLEPLVQAFGAACKAESRN